jgi:hypothetical protein
MPDDRARQHVFRMGMSLNPVAVNRSGFGARRTASRTGCSFSIATTRLIGSPIAPRLSPTLAEDRLKKRCASG